MMVSTASRILAALGVPLLSTLEKAAGSCPFLPIARMIRDVAENSEFIGPSGLRVAIISMNIARYPLISLNTDNAGIGRDAKSVHGTIVLNE